MIRVVQGVLLLMLAAWEPVTQDAAITVERRPAEGRVGLYELRITGHAKVTPEQMIDTLWKHEEYEQFVPRLKKLVILKHDGDEKLLYQQVKAPMIKDRDYVVRVRRLSDPAAHVYETVITNAEGGPPENADHVRIKAIKARWTLSPATEGGTDVVYQIFVDPGESLPSWIVAIGQKSATPDVVRAMIKRAESTH
jgi:ribosome-associated toxin RatA of RatAB toxin-antitoxin module